MLFHDILLQPISGYGYWEGGGVKYQEEGRLPVADMAGGSRHLKGWPLMI